MLNKIAIRCYKSKETILLCIEECLISFLMERKDSTLPLILFVVTLLLSSFSMGSLMAGDGESIQTVKTECIYEGNLSIKPSFCSFRKLVQDQFIMQFLAQFDGFTSKPYHLISSVTEAESLRHHLEDLFLHFRNHYLRRFIGKVSYEADPPARSHWV